MKIQHWKKVNTIIDKHNWERSHSIDNIMPFYFLKRHHQSLFILNILKEFDDVCCLSQEMLYQSIINVSR